ncbi:MFS transporter [Pseudonocardia sp. ICBG1293]|uniref:MFS transporter n=1 Tax=Pseudonocardia sp. ICBG1293 TaxID=2844382 RepID=UPI0035A87630
MLQRTLNVPTPVRADGERPRIDYLGATLIAAAVSALLLWTSLAGKQFGWASPTSFGLIGAGLVLLVGAIVVERRAKDPVVPPFLFRDRTVVLATVASLFVGVAMFGSTIFLSQYFQLARGASATEAGLLTLPMIVGMFGASNIAGQLITRTGVWKRYLVGGAVSLTAGLTLGAAVISSTAPYWLVAIAMALVGIGVGTTQQNLVLAVQNTVALRHMGAASSTVTFFRSLGGSAGVAGLGALLASVVGSRTAAGLAEAGVDGGAAVGGGQVPHLADLPEPVRSIVMEPYGHATSMIFLVAAPLALLALAAILALREVPLRDTLDIEKPADPGTGAAATVPAPPSGPTGPVLHGFVRADGAPAGGAVLTVLDGTGDELGRTRADADGHYRICVATGIVSTVYRWEGRPAARRVAVGEDGLRLDVDLPAGTASAGAAGPDGQGRPEFVSVIEAPERERTGADRG